MKIKLNFSAMLGLDRKHFTSHHCQTIKAKNDVYSDLKFRALKDCSERPTFKIFPRRDQSAFICEASRKNYIFAVAGFSSKKTA